MCPQFILPGCEHEVNLDAASIATLKAQLEAGDVPATAFDKLYAAIEKELAGDVMPRFVTSALWTSVCHPVEAAAAVPPSVTPHQRSAPRPSPVVPTRSARSPSSERSVYLDRLSQVSLALSADCAVSARCDRSLSSLGILFLSSSKAMISL